MLGNESGLSGRGYKTPGKLNICYASSQALLFLKSKEPEKE